VSSPRLHRDYVQSAVIFHCFSWFTNLTFPLFLFNDSHAKQLIVLCLSRTVLIGILFLVSCLIAAMVHTLTISRQHSYCEGRTNRRQRLDSGYWTDRGGIRYSLHLNSGSRFALRIFEHAFRRIFMLLLSIENNYINAFLSLTWTKEPWFI